ncbi:ABC transporter [Xylaria sp. FL0043]|nr:ABC transporter [Xylaria sp. FL0043]
MTMGIDNGRAECIEKFAFGFPVGADMCRDGVVTDFTATLYSFIYWLSLTTTFVFIPLSTLRIVRLLRVSTVRLSTSRIPVILLISKLVAGASLAALRLALIVVVVRHTELQTTRSLVSAVSQFAIATLLVLLSTLEHFRSKSASAVSCSYLFFAFIYDLTRVPSLWARGSSSDFAPSISQPRAVFTILFTAALVVEAIFLVLESWSRREWNSQDVVERSPEETSNVFGLGLYSWLIPLLWRGYHVSLSMKDLYALDRTISIDNIVHQLRPTAEPYSPVEPAGTSSWQLICWVTKSLPWTLVRPVLPRLLLLGFTLSQPFFLQRLLDFLSSNGTTPNTASEFIAVTVFIYSGIAVSTGFYWYYQERFQSSLRGWLIHAIYAKTIAAPHLGDGDTAAVTLMGTDVERIYTGLRLMHEVWASLIQIAIAAWLLYRQIGLAFLAPLIVVLLGFANSFYLSRRAVTYQAAWMARVQSRIGITSSFLSAIKDLRFSGMISPAASLVQREREEELRVGERSRTLTGTSASLSQLPQAIAPALAFAFGPRVLNESRAFTALSLLALLTAPLMMVLQSVPIIAAAIACLRRIKLFLARDPRQDPRRFEIAAVGLAGLAEKAESSRVGEEGFVCIQGGAFSWKADRIILQGINFSLPRSSITFVVGQVGVGKSTLCRALLGEVPYSQGRISLKSNKIGYCDQTPFLFNASIKENIVGFSAFDSKRYMEVLEAVALIKDLNSLPAGENTVIGTKGISLSGGQRQRISLARALYIDADILILDDIFIGLDGLTQERVCKAVFGPQGLLRKRGTTALLCTHSTHFLSMASHIMVVSPAGTITEQGSFGEIQKGEWYRAHVSPTLTPGIIAGVEDLALEHETLEIELSTPKYPRPDSSPQALQTLNVPPPGVDISVYRHWLSTIGILLPVVYLLLAIGIGFFTNFPTIWLKWWSEDATRSTPHHSFGYWIGIYALLGAGVVLCVFPAGLIMLRNAVRLSGTELHHATVDTVSRSSLRFLANTDVGKILNLFSQDMNIIDTQLPRMMNNMCFALSNAVGQAVVIALSSAWLALSYPLFLALLWVVQRVYLPTSKRLRLLDLEAKTPLYTNFLDTLMGLPTIRAFGWLHHHQSQNDALLDESQRPSYLLAMAQQWLMLTMNIIVALIAVILVALATQLGSDAGSVGAGLVTLITLGGTLTQIVIAYTGLETSLGAISRLKSFGEETESEGAGKVDDIPHPLWPTQGRVQFRDVSASYDDENKVLRELNFMIDAGEKVALCGRTGSGKSSVFALLMRLIEPVPSNKPETSPILIDDLPLDKIDHTILRERILSASQDPVFLPAGTSFRQNLDPWTQATEAECTAVLRDLDFAAIVADKGGLDAPLTALSAGQKQLFSLARMVLRRRVRLRQMGVDGGLLLLDEATSSADAETMRRVRMLLRDEFAAYTVLMVTHHRDVAVGCDRVIVLDGGAVVEEGTPDELLEREDSWFRKLFGS